MGNRAVLTFATTKSAPCIYLHWNGGRASVEAFLLAARHLNLNAPMQGMGDGTRFDTQAQVLDAIAAMIRDDFGMSSVYRETYGNTDTDNWDNGVYVLDDALDIVGRKFKRHDEELDDDKTQAIYAQIIDAHHAREAV